MSSTKKKLKLNRTTVHSLTTLYTGEISVWSGCITYCLEQCNTGPMCG